MAAAPPQIVLGSRSPRRLVLLSHLIPRERIVIVPPLDTLEADFDGVTTWSEIEERVQEIARAKGDDVRSQPAARGLAVLTADTVIVGDSAEGALAVLGQPPADETWRDVVREWFRTYYFGRTHVAMTAVCLTAPDGGRSECLVRSDVVFSADGEQFLDWYLATGEPCGKAGGYALQGAGSIFVERIEGSLSNIVGLPLRETAGLLQLLSLD